MPLSPSPPNDNILKPLPPQHIKPILHLIIYRLQPKLGRDVRRPTTLRLPTIRRPTLTLPSTIPLLTRFPTTPLPAPTLLLRAMSPEHHSRFHGPLRILEPFLATRTVVPTVPLPIVSMLFPAFPPVLALVTTMHLRLSLHSGSWIWWNV